MGSVTLERCLCSAIETFNARGLSKSAIWVGELLQSAPDAFLATTVPVGLQRVNEGGSSVGAKSGGVKDDARCELGRAMFAVGEYMRCHVTLRNSTSARGKFLSLYALFMDGERRKGDSSDQGATNTHLPALEKELDALLDEKRNPQCATDPYLAWLLGVVLREAGRTSQAGAQLLRAIRLNPLLWCAWEDLASTCTNDSVLDLTSALVPDELDWMHLVFSALLYLQLHQLGRSKECWLKLRVLLPTSPFITAKLATCLFQKKEMEPAENLFAALHAADPYRVESMDDYSHVLYIQGEAVKCALLAQHLTVVDRDRPETNCVIGNYYSLMRRHEKSVAYFRRAVTLDPRCLSAWILMGHEFVEMNNTHAAVAAYRAALLVDQRDYRPWYGMGQVYELLQMYHYALHYYTFTTHARPFDSRMWAAVAGCLEHQGRTVEAIQCYVRAEAVEPSATEYYAQLVKKLADMYVDINKAKAATYYEKYLMADHRRQEETVFVQCFLAEYHVAQAAHTPSSGGSGETEGDESGQHNREAAAVGHLDRAEQLADAILGRQGVDWSVTSKAKQLKSDIAFARSFVQVDKRNS